jgi:hypothetical protein
MKRTVSPDQIGRVATTRRHLQALSTEHSMNNPWDQWSPYWWQTATAAPPFGGQPNEGWNQTAYPVYAPAASSGLSSGILGLLAQSSNESSSYQLPKPTSLLGQFLTGAGMAQASQDASQAETEARAGSYSTPAVGRASNMEYCVRRYVKCQDLHGGAMLRNGKRCGDCFNMCTLYGTWPSWYCPL